MVLREFCPISIIKEGSRCAEAAPFHHGQVFISILLSLLLQFLSKLIFSGLPNSVMVVTCKLACYLTHTHKHIYFILQKNTNCLCARHAHVGGKICACVYIFQHVEVQYIPCKFYDQPSIIVYVSSIQKPCAFLVDFMIREV